MNIINASLLELTDFAPNYCVIVASSYTIKS